MDGASEPIQLDGDGSMQACRASTKSETDSPRSRHPSSSFFSLSLRSPGFSFRVPVYEVYFGTSRYLFRSILPPDVGTFAQEVPRPGPRRESAPVASLPQVRPASVAHLRSSPLKRWELREDLSGSLEVRNFKSSQE